MLSLAGDDFKPRAVTRDVSGYNVLYNRVLDGKESVVVIGLRLQPGCKRRRLWPKSLTLGPSPEQKCDCVAFSIFFVSLRRLSHAADSKLASGIYAEGWGLGMRDGLGVNPHWFHLFILPSLPPSSLSSYRVTG